MGKIFRLAGVTLTDLDAPRILVVDPVETYGSLMLVDPSNPFQSWGSGAPSNGVALPNLLLHKAKELLQSAADSDLSALFYSNFQATDGVVQRSTKGGLHGITSKSTAVIARGAYIHFGLALRDYIIANKTHQFYFSQIARRTRLANTTSGRYMEFGDGGNYVAYMSPGECRSRVGGVGVPQTRINAGNALGGNRFVSVAASANSGDAINLGNALMQWGPIISAGALVNTMSSEVFYRAYAEDLTVSGRSFAEVDAIEQATFAKLFGPGGRYAEDSWNDPATVLP
jgi:hypothetical protein